MRACEHQIVSERSGWRTNELLEAAITLHTSRVTSIGLAKKLFWVFTDGVIFWPTCYLDPKQMVPWMSVVLVLDESIIVKNCICYQ